MLNGHANQPLFSGLSVGFSCNSGPFAQKSWKVEPNKELDEVLFGELFLSELRIKHKTNCYCPSPKTSTWRSNVIDCNHYDSDQRNFVGTVTHEAHVNGVEPCQHKSMASSGQCQWFSSCEKFVHTRQNSLNSYLFWKWIDSFKSLSGHEWSSLAFAESVAICLSMSARYGWNGWGEISCHIDTRKYMLSSTYDLQDSCHFYADYSTIASLLWD